MQKKNKMQTLNNDNNDGNIGMNEHRKTIITRKRCIFFEWFQ